MEQRLSNVTEQVAKQIVHMTKGHETVEFMVNGKMHSAYSNRVQPIRELNYLLENFIKSLDGNSLENPFNMKWVTKVENWFKTHGEHISITDLPHSTIGMLNKFEMAVYGSIKLR